MALPWLQQVRPWAHAIGAMNRAAPAFANAYNRNLEATTMRQFDVIVEKDSAGYFIASVPALPGCHTQAKSLDDLMARIREAVELCLEVQGEPPEPLDFIGVQRISVAV